MELPPQLAGKYSSTSDVLTNEDLLKKILLRLECRSCLVHAALTSKFWLRCASGLCVPDFCKRHQPHRLGVYISSAGITGSEFIPLPDAFTPEVSAVNHANFGFGDLTAPNVLDCRNGIILFEFGGETFHPDGLAVRSPLHPNMNNAVELPPSPEPFCFSEGPHAVLLSADYRDTALCYRVSVRTWQSANKVMVQALVCVLLRSRSWAIRCITTGTPLAKSPVQILPTTVLVGGKIYMATQAGYILGLDLGKAKFFIVDLPEGVEVDQYPGHLVHCRGDDSVLYLFHVDRDNRLNVWLRRMNDDHEHSGAGAAGGSTNGWMLRETISVRETCGHLVEQGWERAAEGDEDAGVVMVVGAGDNAEFVFLELGVTGVIVYMHLKTREVKQVYQREPDDDYVISVRPFMLVRRPVFPPVQDAHA